MEQQEQDVYGLIGFPLSHSFSPAYFNNKFLKEEIDAHYQLFPIAEIGLFKDVLLTPNLKGLNVTIPYKTSVMPFLEQIDAAAQQIGAVNCIAIRNGKPIGFNTDVLGFENSIRSLLLPWHTKALVLGSGGASKAVAYVLNRLHIPYKVVSRNAALDILKYEDITPDVLQEHTIIINTTPLGMWPNVHDAPPIDYSRLTERHLLYDLVYNPEYTEFMKLGAAKGASVSNGMEMLIGQAEAAWTIWNK